MKHPVVVLVKGCFCIHWRLAGGTGAARGPAPSLRPFDEELLEQKSSDELQRAGRVRLGGGGAHTGRRQVCKMSVGAQGGEEFRVNVLIM